MAGFELVIEYLLVFVDYHQIVVAVLVEFEIGLIELSLRQIAIVVEAGLPLRCLVHVCQRKPLRTFEMSHRLIFLLIITINSKEFAFACVHWR